MKQYELNIPNIKIFAFHSYSKRKPHFNSSYHQISKILRSQVSTSSHKIFAHFLFQAQNRTLTHPVTKIFENSRVETQHLPSSKYSIFISSRNRHFNSFSKSYRQISKNYSIQSNIISTSLPLAYVKNIRTVSYSKRKPRLAASSYDPTTVSITTERDPICPVTLEPVPGFNSRLSILRHV